MKNTFYRRSIAAVLSLLLVLSVMMAVPATVFADDAPFYYKHDPRLNAKAMADIIVDPEAVFGFSPSPAGSLAAYAAYDWTDANAVEEYRQNRLDYLHSYDQMYDMFDNMTAEGKSVEEIARAVNVKRNELRFAAVEGDPEQLAIVKARNLEKYGHEEGPTADEIYEKNGSWEIVIEKAFSHNSGMDACVGLYDDYYEYYISFGYIEDERVAAASREYTVASFIDASGLQISADRNIPTSFADANDVSAAYVPEVALAVETGTIKGYDDGTFRPQGKCLRRQMVTFLYKYDKNVK